jgi:hypothetical protein
MASNAGTTGRAGSRAAGRRAVWQARWRLAAAEWAVLLADPETQVRYHAKVHRRGHDQCWYWLGAISDTGHGKLRAGTRTTAEGRPGTRVVASHVYGFQLSRGPLRPAADGKLPVIRHRCDESGCHNPSHWLTGSVKDNAADYAARALAPGSPLTDRRGPAVRARAIRDAILKALADGTGVEHAITRAAGSGMPAVQDPLFQAGSA